MMNSKLLPATISIFFLWFANQPIQAQKDQPKKDCRKDADDDGINDCFDQCADTPAGIRVDSKGCPRDTDADGIPDYLDKQLITPTECQPSDSNGVGKCDSKRNL